MAGDGQLLDWVHAAFAAENDSNQSALCLQCHRELGRDAVFAHGIDAELFSVGEATSTCFGTVVLVFVVGDQGC